MNTDIPKCTHDGERNLWSPPWELKKKFNFIYMSSGRKKRILPDGGYWSSKKWTLHFKLKPKRLLQKSTTKKKKKDKTPSRHKNSIKQG